MVEKINQLKYSEIIVGLEKAIGEDKLELLKRLNSIKIRCIIKTHDNIKYIDSIKEKYNFIDRFSEMWLMPFPKTEVAERYQINKCDYMYINPKDAERFKEVSI